MALASSHSLHIIQDPGQQEPANAARTMAALEWLGVLPTQAAADVGHLELCTLSLQGLANLA